MFGSYFLILYLYILRSHSVSSVNDMDSIKAVSSTSESKKNVPQSHTFCVRQHVTRNQSIECFITKLVMKQSLFITLRGKGSVLKRFKSLATQQAHCRVQRNPLLLDGGWGQFKVQHLETGFPLFTGCLDKVHRWQRVLTLHIAAKYLHLPSDWDKPSF